MIVENARYFAGGNWSHTLQADEAEKPTPQARQRSSLPRSLGKADITRVGVRSTSASK